MKVVSPFDGMSCGMIALQEFGIPVERYVAFEIDKYAIKTSAHNFPNIEHRGNVFDADFKEFKGFDLVMGGSPCTYWSIAKTKGREKTASGLGWELFSQYVRCLHEAEPKFFIYENNKSMSADIRQSITETFGFEPVEINSALVSAQNRKRLYWVGIRQENGSYKSAGVEQPEDMGILLKDVLNDSFALKEKSRAVIGSIGRTTEREFSGKNQGEMVAEEVKPLTEREIDYMTRKTDFSGRLNFIQRPAQDDKSKCIVANISKGVPYNVCAEPLNVTEDGKSRTLIAQYEPRPNGELSRSQGFRIYSIHGKSVALTSNGGGVGAKTGLYAIPVDQPCKQIPVYEVKDGMILVKGKGYPIKLADGFYVIRKLTVSECMRLQTVPAWYEFPVSNSQAYKMLGNGWTINVIKWILGYLK